MKYASLTLLSIVLVTCQLAVAAAAPPNILLIVADDLGYTDLGCYGGEISTPNLDTFAKQATRMSNFYACPTCSLSRASLLTGVDHHRTGFGTMVELPDQQELKQRPGYEGYLNRRVVTIAETLKKSGYYTTIAGKWHLGAKPDNRPHARGFDDTFVLLEAGASHWDNKPIHPGSEVTYCRNGNVCEIPNNFYSTTTYTEKLIDSLSRAGDQPFFAMLAYTAPHYPLHAPETTINKYLGEYDEGYEVLRERRLVRMKELGLLPRGGQPSPRARFARAWNDLKPQRQAFLSKQMSVYAAMIELLDESIGRVFDHLKNIGQYENTFVIFLSDNGADGFPMRMYGITDDWIDEHYPENTIENLGNPDSFVNLGPGWAQVSVGASAWFKGLTAEGGLLVPCLMKLPGNVVRTERWSAAFATVKDIAPTILEVAQTEHPNSYRGTDVFPLEGASMVPVLKGERENVHPEEYAMGWEFNHHKGLRQGPWKLRMLSRPFSDGGWKLYHVQQDPGETLNLSTRHSQRFLQMIELWSEYADAAGVVDR